MRNAKCTIKASFTRSFMTPEQLKESAEAIQEYLKGVYHVEVKVDTSFKLSKPSLI
jgi:hypothetical protein